MVAVIIPNYNGMKYLKPCLSSLMEQTCQDYEVVVVDDCSADDSITLCKEIFKSVTFLTREKNGGFSAAVNDGLRYSISKGREYSILLNNDTTVEPDFIEKMLKAAGEKPDCFSIQAKMVSMKEPDILDDAGNFYMLTGWAYARGKGKTAEKYTKQDKIFSSCAGAAIYRNSAFEKIGYFDELHFAYLEDVDIGYRAGIFGYHNYYEPGAVVYHAGSATSGSRYNEFKIRLAARNSVLLIYKNQTILQWMIHFPALFAGFIVKQLFFSLKGFGLLYHKSVLEGFKLCFTKEIKSKKVRFHWKHLGNYIKIEWELWVNTFRRFFD